MTTPKKAAFEALSEVTRVMQGCTWTQTEQRDLTDCLATIRAALQPTAVELVLDANGELRPSCECAVCRQKNRGEFCADFNGVRRYGPTPEAAAQAALDAMEGK
ncbi:MAG: hypothetical protein V1755_05710 [Chloroflexota bacterium]